MEFVIDKHTVVPFRLKVVCAHCGSTLLLNDLKDLRPTTRTTGGNPHDFCEEFAICFRCPLCAENTTLSKESECKLPASVVSAVAKKKAV